MLVKIFIMSELKEEGGGVVSEYGIDLNNYIKDKKQQTAH